VYAKILNNVLNNNLSTKSQQTAVNHHQQIFSSDTNNSAVSCDAYFKALYNHQYLLKTWLIIGCF